MGDNITKSIPRPLVRTNQWFIFISVVIVWITGQSIILLLPLISGLLGLFFNFNPAMRIAKLFLKKEPSKYVPEEWAQQQFNQWIAVFCLTAGFIGFYSGFNSVGYVFTAMVAVASGIAILGFCVGCFIRYHLIRLTAKKASE